MSFPKSLAFLEGLDLTDEQILEILLEILPKKGDFTKPAEAGSYKQARGILAGLDDEPAEVSIRRLRDGIG